MERAEGLAGRVAEAFVFAFAAFEFLGGGSELGVHSFEMGFAFQECFVVVAEGRFLSYRFWLALILSGDRMGPVFAAAFVPLRRAESLRRGTRRGRMGRMCRVLVFRERERGRGRGGWGISQSGLTSAATRGGFFSGFAGGGDLDGVVFGFGDELGSGFAWSDLGRADVAGVGRVVKGG